MVKDSSALIITALVLGMILATLFPYIQQQIASPKLLFVEKDNRYVCPTSFFGSFDVNLQNAGSSGYVYSYIYSKDIYFETKDNKIQHNDSAFYYITNNQLANIRFIPTVQSSYLNEYNKIQNTNITIENNCQKDFFGTRASCKSIKVICNYNNERYPTSYSFRLINEVVE